MRNAYHNRVHGLDVANAVTYLSQKGLGSYSSPFERVCWVVSALCHDLGHPGVNNAFLIATNAKEAFIYNDEHVLENMHCALMFEVIQNKDCNILANLKRQEYSDFRKLAIQLILATDMSTHFNQLASFNNLIEMDELDPQSNKKHQLEVLKMGMKVADIGHGGKKLKMHKHWSRRIVEEFYE